jgi:protein AbiQ
VIRNFKIVKVDYKYCDYLRKFDNKVSYNAGIKELRPFIGILFVVDGCEYFAPLSSPKVKHLTMRNNIDFVKIDNGNYGVVNFNNMIPVTSKNYELFDLNSTPSDTNELKRQNLLKSQLLWLNRNIKNVKGKAIKLYDKYKNDTLPKGIKDRCCNFILLEEKCREYNN